MQGGHHARQIDTQWATARGALGEPRTSNQEPDVAAPDWQPDEYPGTSDSGPMLTLGERIIAERTQRRHQREAAREAPATREPRTGRRRERPAETQSGLTAARRLTLRDSMSLTLIAVLAAGGGLGAILGAVNASGWVIGLLAAGLTVVLSAMSRRYSRST